MAKPKPPPCPVCKSAKQVIAQGVVGDMYLCRKCGGAFDTSPDEGGDYHADPSRRMELQEQRKGRRR